MPHEVKILAASRYNGVGLLTFRLRYWRAMHAEFLTHRTQNRNSGSSRAIPIGTMNAAILADIAGPTHWGKNQSGMQAWEECNELVFFEHWMDDVVQRFVMSEVLTLNEAVSVKYDGQARGHYMTREVAWKFAAWQAVQNSRRFADAGYHKQIANRMTEPYQYINVVMTATEGHLQSFYALRDHKDAFPELRDVAHDIRMAHEAAEFRELAYGEWHLPYVMPHEDDLPLDQLLQLSSSRCAHTSYETVEGEPLGTAQAVRIFQKIVGSDPIHASPTEHQARAGHPPLEWAPEGLRQDWYRSPLEGEWVQYRKFVENNLEVI